MGEAQPGGGAGHGPARGERDGGARAGTGGGSQGADRAGSAQASTVGGDRENQADHPDISADRAVPARDRAGLRLQEARSGQDAASGRKAQTAAGAVRVRRNRDGPGRGREPVGGGAAGKRSPDAGLRQSDRQMARHAQRAPESSLAVRDRKNT